MINLRTESTTKRKFISALWQLFNFFENNNNVIFDQNGERKSIELILEALLPINNELIVFDVGANVGKWSQRFRDLCQKRKLKCHLHLFEPSLKAFKVITSLNDASGLTLNPIALSDQTGSSILYFDEEGSSLASMYQRNLKPYQVELSKKETISTIRADQYIREKNISHIHFIKIDVEGHEKKVLEGLGDYFRNDFIDCIAFEYGGANLDSKTSLLDLYTMLQQRGFVIAKMMKSGPEIRAYRPLMENFQYSNYLAISQKQLGAQR